MYVVATPIGNLEDIGQRAARVLAEVALIAAEDTRVTRKLLARHGIETPLTSHHAHTSDSRRAALVNRLDTEDIAIVSDAGTPGISDPGASLVRSARAAGHRIIAIPGPSAVGAALSISGMPAERYAFVGFLPRRSSDRRRELGKWAGGSSTMVAFEAPHRLRDTLDDLLSVLGDREIVVARELTKHFEEAWSGLISEAIEHWSEDPPRGEFTLVVAGAGNSPAPVWDDAEVLAAIERFRGLDIGAKAASRRIALEAGRPPREIYQLWHRREESSGRSEPSAEPSAGPSTERSAEPSEELSAEPSLDPPKGPFQGDSREERAAFLDPSDMASAVRGLPDQLETAWARMARLEFDLKPATPTAIIVAGMGGSAIAADLVASALLIDLGVPFLVNRGPDLPTWVGDECLVIASSFSGDTSETLAAWDSAAERGCDLIAITAGGALRERARQRGAPCVPMIAGGQPRAALGQSLALVLGVLRASGVIGDPSLEIAAAVAAMRGLVDEDGSVGHGNTADSRDPLTPTELADLLVGRLPVIFAAESLAPAGRRWRGQINENAKLPALLEILPEAHHNAVEGLPGFEWLGIEPFGVLLDAGVPGFEQERIRATTTLLGDLGVGAVSLSPPSSVLSGRLARVMWHVQFADLTSVHLASLREVDPTPIPTIARLKTLLQG